MCLPSVYLNMLSNIIQCTTTFLNPVYRVVETIDINTYNISLHHTPYTQTIHNFINNGFALLGNMKYVWTTWRTTNDCP